MAEECVRWVKIMRDKSMGKGNTVAACDGDIAAGNRAVMLLQPVITLLKTERRCLNGEKGKEEK